MCVVHNEITAHMTVIIFKMSLSCKSTKCSVFFCCICFRTSTLFFVCCFLSIFFLWNPTDYMKVPTLVG